MRNSKLSRISGLYAITPDILDTALLTQYVQQALIGGVNILQYRNKTSAFSLQCDQATQLQSLCRKYGALFIINDNITLAHTIKADGVHIGQEDMVIHDVRQRLGKNVIIGVSCYNRFDLARHAEEAGANYVAFGAIFPSNSKPMAVKAPLSLLLRAKKLAIPSVAIGGISQHNVAQVIAAGANAVAVINGIFGQDDPEAAARSIKHFFSLPNNYLLT